MWKTIKNLWRIQKLAFVKMKFLVSAPLVKFSIPVPTFDRSLLKIFAVIFFLPEFLKADDFKTT